MERGAIGEEIIMITPIPRMKGCLIIITMLTIINNQGYQTRESM